MTPEALAALHAICFEMPRPWSAQEFAGFLDADSTIFAGNSNGFALGRVVVGEAELLTLAVHPDHQGQGIGRQWLSRYHQLARSNGATESFLEVASNNAAAIALYQKAGYSLTATRPRYYRHPNGQLIDALIFSQKFT